MAIMGNVYPFFNQTESFLQFHLQLYNMPSSQRRRSAPQTTNSIFFVKEQSTKMWLLEIAPPSLFVQQ